jgi:hypothetical protein
VSRVPTPLFGLAIAAILCSVTARAQTPAYRFRLLGVFDSQTGAPIEGAEVVDRMQKITAKTTATGSVTLSFLPEGGSLVRIQKVGYQPKDMFIPISPADTVPMTLLLESVATVLPAVVTKDSAPKYISPALNAFEERRRNNVGGHFIAEAELRKDDDKSMTNVIRTLPGLRIDCARANVPASSSQPLGHKMGECWAASGRVNSKYAILGGACEVEIYLDGNPMSDHDLEKLHVRDYGAVEFYAGGASVPMEFARTNGVSCGVLLLWSRER